MCHSTTPTENIEDEDKHYGLKGDLTERCQYVWLDFIVNKVPFVGLIQHSHCVALLQHTHHLVELAIGYH